MSGDGYKQEEIMKKVYKESEKECDPSDEDRNDLQEHMLGSESESEEGEYSGSFTSNSRVSNLSVILDGLEKNGSNKSFTPYKLREIERDNSVLMNRILSHNTRKSQFPVATIRNAVSSNSINRKKKQKEIDHHNLILLKKIQSIKPFGLSQRKK